MTDGPEPPLARLEAALDRETALREAAQRRAERLAQDHEDAYERLLVRCRALEGEVLAGSGERALVLARQAAAEARIVDLEARLSAAEALREERERAHRATLERQSRTLTEAHEAERRRLSADHDAALSAAEDRLHGLRHEFVEAEKAFRVEAYRLSALVALKAEEAEHSAGEAAGLRERLHALLTSSSWRLSRPLRAMGRLLSRVRP